MRCVFPLLVAVPTSCQHRLDDVTLVKDSFSPPAAYTVGDDKPYVRKWSDCSAFRDSRVEVEKLVVWDGRAAITGNSLAIHVSEGSRIENTTAHPQYFALWMQIPKHLQVGQSYELRPAAAHRSIIRTRRWGRKPDDVTEYSILNDGEMTVSGMQGYDVPQLASSRRSVGVINILEDTGNQLRFTLKGALPILQHSGDETYRYNLILDREFTASSRPHEGEQGADGNPH
jgi:hypothetical protein